MNINDKLNQYLDSYLNKPKERFSGFFKKAKNFYFEEEIQGEACNDYIEIEDLLESASYSLPKNTTYDLIIRFCFKEHIYNTNQINEFLYDHNCKLLN